jgi:hypothetical protein
VCREHHQLKLFIDRNLQLTLLTLSAILSSAGSAGAIAGGAAFLAIVAATAFGFYYLLYLKADNGAPALNVV